MTAPVHPCYPYRDPALLPEPYSTERYLREQADRIAATTPPPVRVVRLAGGRLPGHGRRPRSGANMRCLAEAVAAGELGQIAVERATIFGEPETAERIARDAAHLARLALGVSS